MRIRTTLVAFLAASTPAVGQLNRWAKAAGLKYFGTAVDNSALRNQAYMNIALNPEEFGQVTPANGQKWDATERARGVFSYDYGDPVANPARQAGQILRCHTLVWHSQLPAWVSNILDKDQMERVIRTHITNVVDHYKGQCYAWDVVNEPLLEDGRFRQSAMYKTLGEDFIPLSFKVAAEADPDAKLYLNDYNIGYPGPKHTATLAIIRNIQAKGARIDGVGEQGHFIVGQTPSKADLMRAFAAFAELVEEVAYTELDVRHPRMPPSDAGLQQQALDYVTVVDACLQTPKCIGVTTWDFSDRYSWIPYIFSGQGGACLFDIDLNKKPAYARVLSLLQSAASSGDGSATPSSSASGSF